MITMKELVSKGKILEAYGKNYMLTVSPAPGIDRIRVSLVKLGTKGKDVTDFYMTTSQFITLTTEIAENQGHLFKSKCQKDMTEAFPNAYSYVTGKDGSKKLHIGGGKVGIRIHTSERKDENRFDNKNIAVSFDNLYVMAKLFQVIYGLIPADYYMKSLSDAFWKAQDELSKYYKYDESLDEETPDSTEDGLNEAEETNDTPEAQKPSETVSDASETILKLKLTEAPVVKDDIGLLCFKAVYEDQDGTYSTKPAGYKMPINGSIAKNIVDAFIAKGKEGFEFKTRILAKQDSDGYIPILEFVK